MTTTTQPVKSGESDNELIANNKTIAEFMGLKSGCTEDTFGLVLTDHVWLLPIYQTSWNWLMPVVEKIESMGFELNICQRSCLIMNDYKNLPEPITTENLPVNQRFEITVKSDLKIQSVYESVVKFIKWYDTQREASNG